MKKLCITIALILCTGQVVLANNIQVSGVSVSGQNTSANTTQINFNVSWENSWRTSTNESNYDGAYIFIKFRKHGTSLWQHASINYSSSGASAAGHTTPADGTIISTTDKMGAYLFRNANYIGDVNYSGISLRWNYGEDDVLDTDSVEVKVMAIEMVYIPEGGYYLGSGGTEYNAFQKGGTSSPYKVSSDSEIIVGGDSNLVYTPYVVIYSSYGYPSYWYGGDGLGPIPESFPNAYKGFWIMKYECSQQQYADFLNLLDNAKATVRNNGICTGTHPSLIAPIPERAMGNLSANDLVAYADWCGLRPMSEMEYEKSCRGVNILPIANEYAWGNTTVENASGITNAGLNNESRTLGNCNYNNSNPMRCGIFANDTTSRISSGATYYGVMEMSGNVSELTISVGSTQGRNVSDTVHGNGVLSNLGETDIPEWTSFANSSSVASKGGYFGVASTVSYLTLSGRYFSISDISARNPSYGIRLVRSANQ